MHGYVFGPTSTSGMIRRSISNFAADLPDAPAVERVSVYPGLLSDGSPTSNASLTVSENNIDADDDYGFITTIDEP